jgi:hypothetical protein
MKISDLKEIGGSEIDPSMFKTYTPPTYVGGYRIGKELTGSIQFNLHTQIFYENMFGLVLV